MNKKKIVVLIASIVMICTLAIGGTLAYFVDTDAKTNTFTVGNVDITLNEVFDKENAKLMPTTGKDENGNVINAIEKRVTVTNNDGSENAYVRVHIAIPAILDDGDPSFNAAANTLHFNYAKGSVAEGEWSWWNADGSWNAYTDTIDGVNCNVYVVTYQTALAGGATTKTEAMHQVYLDSKTTNEQIESINTALDGNWKIWIVAEGAQEEGFNDATTALNTAFGVPGTYDVAWDVD